MPSQTLVDIANMALVSINKDPIKSLSTVPGSPNGAAPTTKTAAIINIVINQTIRWTQANSRWSDLLTKVTLSLVSGPSDDGNYTYALPTDVVGIPTLVSGAVYEVQGAQLVTPDPSAQLWYVRESLNPSEWNPFLTQAVVDVLASKLAPKLDTTMKVSQAAEQRAHESLIDNNSKDYIFRSSPIQKDGWYALNQAREGIGGRYPGTGAISRFRGSSYPRYPQTSP